MDFGALARGAAAFPPGTFVRPLPVRPGVESLHFLYARLEAEDVEPVAGLPFAAAYTLFWSLLKMMCEAVPGTPVAGVVWFRFKAR